MCYLYILVLASNSNYLILIIYVLLEMQKTKAAHYRNAQVDHGELLLLV